MIPHDHVKLLKIGLCNTTVGEEDYDGKRRRRRRKRPRKKKKKSAREDGGGEGGDEDAYVSASAYLVGVDRVRMAALAEAAVAVAVVVLR